MKRKPPLNLFLLLAIFTAFALLASLSGSLDTGLFHNPAGLWKRLLWPLIRLTFFISIGLFVAQIIEGMGWTDRLAVMARPFIRWGHLTDQMGAVFTTAFFSGTASLSMLMTFYKDGFMSRKEIIFAVLLNTFPTFFLHLPTTVFILLPLVGTAGALYLLITFGAALLRLGVILTCTHFMLPEFKKEHHPLDSGKKDCQELFKDMREKFKSRLTRMLMIILPVYLIIAIVSDMGFFLWLRKTLAHGISNTFVPVEAMSIVIFSLVAEFTSGYAAAGAMLKAGTLNVFQTVTALLLGNIIAAPVRALRHQMPYYMGIFNPKLGIYLMLASQGFRVVSLMLAGLIFILCANMVG